MKHYKPTAVNQQKTIPGTAYINWYTLMVIHLRSLALAGFARPSWATGWLVQFAHGTGDRFGFVWDRNQDAVVLKWPLGRSLTANWKILKAQRNDTECYVNHVWSCFVHIHTTLASKTLANLYANCVNSAWQSYPLDVTLKTLDVSPLWPYLDLSFPFRTVTPSVIPESFLMLLGPKLWNCLHLPPNGNCGPD